MVSVDRIRELLEYSPETGVLTYRIGGRGGTKAGDIAGWLGKNGYWYVSINRNKHLVHRVIWVHQTGIWPSHEVDHRDRDSTNNRWANLREATHSQNLMNQRFNAKNTSGFKGVGFDKARGKWTAEIKAAGRKYHLGRFATIEAATTARQNAAIELHGEYGGRP